MRWTKQHLASLKSRLWIERDGAQHVVKESHKDAHTTLCGLFVRGVVSDAAGADPCEDCITRTMPGTGMRNPKTIPIARLRGRGIVNKRPTKATRKDHP